MKIHLYGGLICFWYLIILGTSSLNFNHHFGFMQRSGETETWSKQVQIAKDFQDNLAFSEALRDSLALIGWPLPWETYRDSTGIFHFALEHPGKRYTVDFSLKTREAQVRETSKGFWPVFNAMHGAGAVPNSAFMHLWKWYTRLTVVLVVFSVLIGIYLWYAGNRDKRAGIYTLAVSLIASAAWMIYLYFKG
ncbi:MAG TPA: PepSY-associated TM helix domain-containing protein [Chryseosolibacter sp.]